MIYVKTFAVCLKEFSYFNFHTHYRKKKIKKKIKFSHDCKITVQVFNTFSSKFPQIITNLTEDTELTFTERLERSYLIITLLIALVSHILKLCC